MILDVDGVLTDGRIILDDRGEETKCFHVRDGLGIKMLIRSGVEVVIVTGRQSRVVDLRAAEIGIKGVYQGVEDKGALCDALIRERNLPREAVCCVGDDLPDLALFSRAGFSVAVADASPEVREAADFITRNRGGSGAVREVCEVILKSMGKWDPTPAPLRGE
jgi:YrbI family 3-deoxy-D-manno-octulosonate 8-phosphate phosphatase